MNINLIEADVKKLEKEYTLQIVNNELYIFNTHASFIIGMVHPQQCVMHVVKYNNLTYDDIKKSDRTDSIYNMSGNGKILFLSREWYGLYQFIMDVVSYLKIYYEEKNKTLISNVLSNNLILDVKQIIMANVFI